VELRKDQLATIMGLCMRSAHQFRVDGARALINDRIKSEKELSILHFLLS
jgi:hypothetical protein